MRKIYLLFLPLFLFSAAQAQLTVDNTGSAADVIEDVFLANGIFVSNITFSGTADQIGTFDGSNSNAGISEGIIMASGDVTGAIGPNNSGSFTLGGGSFNFGDVDLEALNPGYTYNDASIVEFDFIATGDSLSFEYVFGSDEYAEYVGSTFNDLFGFFISGPGIAGAFTNGAVNIATIPGTTLPVAINNLNNGLDGLNGPCAYCQYYNYNGDGFTLPYSADDEYIQYDGFTTPLTANIGGLQLGEVYHIKLAIADAGDQAFDSGVFLKGDSFVQVCTPEVNLMPDGCMISSLHANVEYTEECGTISLTNLSEINIETTNCYYEMGDGNETAACDANTMYTYAESGTYTVKLVYMVNEFRAKFTVAELLISDTAPATPVIVQNGNMLEVSNWDGLSTLQWFVNGAEILNATTNTVLIEESGSYTVMANNGCPVTSAAYSAVGLNEMLDENGFAVYPNPSEGVANVKLPMSAHTLQLFSTNGQLVSAQQVANQKMIQLTAPAGVYNIRIADANGNTLVTEMWMVK